MDDRIDAYRVLQVDSSAEGVVIHAAYRALARLYHPDGKAPDAGRMLAINRAWSLVGTADARQRYDAHRRLRATGPGIGAASAAGAAVNPTARTYDAWESPLRPRREDVGEIVLDFGRYAGWRLSDVLRHDADYLRWLCRQSAGLRYRDRILQLLPNEPDLDRRSKSVA